MTDEALQDVNEAACGQSRSTAGLGVDWQITTILSDDILVETDCNSCAKRTLRKSACKCGQPVLIEYNARTCRADGKRIFYPDQDDTGWCAFRCKSCHEPVSETVPGAEYGETPNEPAKGRAESASSD